MAALKPLRYADRFRGYQKSAIRTARRYRVAFRAGDCGGACLVCHPTGTGKTAVIAGVAHCSPEVGNVVILTTRQAVRDQLLREVSANIFLEPTKFGLSDRVRLEKNVYVVRDGDDFLKPISSLIGRTARALTLESRFAFVMNQFKRLVDDEEATLLSELENGRSILVMTVQMLAVPRHDGAFQAVQKALEEHTDFLLFDEGHYEPAVKWSKAVRSLGVPTVLLSATPFRNDLKPFQIEKGNVDIFKYEAACAARHVRQVRVVPRSPAREASAFCRDVLEYCAEAFGADTSRWPRIIIHCDSSTRITLLGEEFVRAGHKVVGIHDRFPDKQNPRPWQQKHVPNPRTSDADVWIHQYKLMEGIDDHRFRVLAFFDPMRNVRSVVQQIGRVIRRMPDDPHDDALVLDHYNGSIAEYWGLYTRYDSSLAEEYLLETLVRFYLGRLSDAQPAVDYIDRRFRDLLVLDALEAVGDEILFDRRVQFRVVERNAQLSEFTSLVEQSFEMNDVEYARCVQEDDAVVYVFAGVSSPEFLRTKYFAEVRHGAQAVILLRDHGLLAVADSKGGAAAAMHFNHLEAVDSKRLERLLSPGRFGRVSGVSSRNTNLGNRVIRSRSVSAPSIGDTPPILDEHGHVLSALTGYNGDRRQVVDDLAYVIEGVGADFEARRVPVPPDPSAQRLIFRRYVGVATGRVSEVGPPIRYRVLREWIASLVEQMTNGTGAAGVFSRFASDEKSEVTNDAARSLLLDTFDAEEIYRHRETGEGLAGNDLCVSRVGAPQTKAGQVTSTFSIDLNGETHRVDVIFSRKSQRYKLESSSIDETFSDTDEPSNAPLTRFINERQSFSIIPDDVRVIYVHGRFYAPGLKYGPRFNVESFHVGHCLYPSRVLAGISKEKGDHVLRADGSRNKNGGTHYDPESVFGLVDSWSNGFSLASLRINRDWIGGHRLEDVNMSPTLIVCDDMDKETADFILADEGGGRVVLVHAKASSSYRPFSASAIQEVCAQAQKNTRLFSMFALSEPPNLKRWDSAHKFAGVDKVRLSMTDRVRKPRGLKAVQAWDKLRPMLQNPLTHREVWLVLGNMLSAARLLAELQRDEPDPETLQVNHLLQTTIAAVGSVGAKLRVFCAP